MLRMTNPTALAASAADPSSAAAVQCASVAPALYRAALGPVNLDHYLAAFERLDAAGRVQPGWNLAAALCPLGWMAFRRLWGPALWLSAALAAGILLLWGAGRQWLAVPLPVLAGLALAWLMMLCGGLGLYGDALVHADARRRIVRAVSAAATLREAMDLLQRQASSRRRLLALMAWAAVLLVPVGVWLALPVAPGAQGMRDVAGREPALLPMPKPEPALQSSGEESEPDPVDQSPAEPPVPDTRPEDEQPSAQIQAQPKAPPPVAEQAAHQSTQRSLYINAGLFADPENARRTHARLQQAGLPCSIEPLTRADGTRLHRVRVGPFGSAAQANAAMVKVRAMGLEAVAAAQ